tara:strand:- start:75 stop:272 length:198 start_codon:yes stop_codon:yes gene_type:complete
MPVILSSALLHLLVADHYLLLINLVNLLPDVILNNDNDPGSITRENSNELEITNWIKDEAARPIQ